MSAGTPGGGESAGPRRFSLGHPGRLVTGRRAALLALLLVTAVVALVLDCARTRRAERRVAEEIQLLTRRHSAAVRAAEAGEDRRTWRMVQAIYRRRAYRPLWSDGARPGPQADQLVRALGEARRQGIDPEVYAQAGVAASLRRLERFTQLFAPAGPEALARLDVTLSYDYARYAWHLLYGRVPLAALDADWWREPRPQDLEVRLERAAARRRVARELSDLLPREPGYRRLLEALARYSSIAARGGWPAVSPGEDLAPGASGPRVAELRVRLIASGDLPPKARGASAAVRPRGPSWSEDRPAAAPGPGYDEVVTRAVVAFQTRHGLRPTGIVDAATRAALAVPVEDRIRQIELNLERWRWLPAALGDPRVEINIPDYSLELIEHGRPAFTTRVVVGRPESPTPVFSARVAWAELDPTWTVPRSIVVNEIVPALERDVRYLARNHMRLIRPADGDSEQVDPGEVRWEDAGQPDFDVQVREDAGPENPLGRIRFTCPNEYDVYLHDTPARQLFAAAARDLSHGCIRVEKPIELADRLLRVAGTDSTTRVEDLLAHGTPARLRFRKPVPVHVLYWTAWVDEAGRVQFRDDVYGLDARLEEALASGHTSSFRLNPERVIVGP